MQTCIRKRDICYIYIAAIKTPPFKIKFCWYFETAIRSNNLYNIKFCITSCQRVFLVETLNILLIKVCLRNLQEAFIFCQRSGMTSVTIWISTHLWGLKISQSVRSTLYALTVFPPGVVTSVIPKSYNSFLHCTHRIVSSLGFVKL